MSIEALKEQARRHEQKEEWLKALDQYKKAISRLEAEDQPDIGLYNRVGDIYVRVGNLADAVDAYERSVDLYMESGLPNNAIALCKKIIRNVPERDSVYLRMGQIRAEQGFLPDARSNFLMYAERMQQAGDLDESFRALVEFCDLAPEDVDVRVAVAEQMASHERTGDAVAQLALAHRALMRSGETERANDVESRALELSPDVSLDELAEAAGFMTESGFAGGTEIVADFGEIEFGSSADPEAHQDEEDEEPAFSITSADADDEEAEAEPLPMLDVEDDGEAEALPTFDDEEEAEPLPTFDIEDEDEDAEPLPTLDFDDEGEAEPLPTLDLDAEDAERGLPVLDDEELVKEAGVFGAEAFGEADHGEREAREYVVAGKEMPEVEVDLPDFTLSGESLEEAIEEVAGDLEPSLESLRADILATPDDVELRQRLVEHAYGVGDETVLLEAYLGLAGALERGDERAKAKAAYQQALQLDPANETAKAGVGEGDEAAPPAREVASHEEYVDLGSLIFDDEVEKTTRFVVAYEEPSGDEDADFAKMLTQFKEKVSENLDAGDVRAHHDLGTAYKEMGLLSEAVAEFQQALRASAEHLPTYELLGQTFMEMGQPEAAVRSLERALEFDSEIEDELVGIYYYLARAYELVGNKKSALEFYDRVFSLDINFADVTERLRALR